MNKVPVSKILVFRRKSDPSYSFIIIVIYFLEAGKFFFLVDALDSWFWGKGEDRTTGTVMFCLLVVKTKTFLNANLSFLWSELPDTYSIYVHVIWILGLSSGGRGYEVHGVNAVHECWIEFFSKEGDKVSLIDYPTGVDSDFEFIDVGENFILALSDGLEAGKGFCLEVSGEKGFGEGVFKVSEGFELLVINGIRGEGCCPS